MAGFIISNHRLFDPSSALSCTIHQGPGGTYFSITMHNQHMLHTVRIYKNGVFFGEAAPGQTYFRDDFLATDRVRLYNLQAATFLQDASLNTDWLVNAYLTFFLHGRDYSFGQRHLGRRSLKICISQTPPFKAF